MLSFIVFFPKLTLSKLELAEEKFLEKMNAKAPITKNRIILKKILPGF